MLEKDKIIKWSDMDLSHLELSINSATNGGGIGGSCTKYYESSPFPIDPVINGRVALWYGDLFSLCLDGLIQTTNETLDDLPPVLVSRTGHDYVHAVRQEIKSIRTGESRFAKTHPNLPCRHLLLTVSPKYIEKYRTAAETALFSCYNGVLQKAVERSMTAIGIPPLHSGNRSGTGFPDELGIHIALRTVRRFLEKGHTYPYLIVLSVSDPSLFKLYESLMVTYFPREPIHEIYACSHLPPAPELGDDNGSTWIPDRRIRIFSNPAIGPNSSRSIDDSLSLSIFPELNRDFITMKDDVDKERLLLDKNSRRRSRGGSFTGMTDREKSFATEAEIKEREARILRRARSEDLSSIIKTGCLFRSPSGTDRLGRPIIVVIGKWFLPEQLDLDKAFLLLVKLLDEINGPYSVIYFHSRTESENRPNFKWMRNVYDNMEYRFKKNLKSLCIVHPTLWTKVLTWWFTTFMAPAIKPKLNNVAGLQDLFNLIVEPDQIQIPAFISEHDISLHGYGGVAYSLTHSKSNTPTGGRAMSPGSGSGGIPEFPGGASGGGGSGSGSESSPSTPFGI